MPDEHDAIIDQAGHGHDEEIDGTRAQQLIELHQPITRDADAEGDREAGGGEEHRPGGRTGAEVVLRPDHQIQRVADRQQRQDRADHDPLHLVPLGQVDGVAEAVYQADDAGDIPEPGHRQVGGHQALEHQHRGIEDGRVGELLAKHEAHHEVAGEDRHEEQQRRPVDRRERCLGMALEKDLAARKNEIEVKAHRRQAARRRP